MNLTPEEFKRIQDVLGVAIAGKIQAAISSSSLNVIVSEQVSDADGTVIFQTVRFSSGDFANVLSTDKVFVQPVTFGSSSASLVTRAFCSNGSVSVVFNGDPTGGATVNILVVR